MDRLKKSLYAVRTMEALRSASTPRLEAALPAGSEATPASADDISPLGLTNAILGNDDGDCLSLGVLDCTQVGIFGSLREVRCAACVLGAQS